MVALLEACDVILAAIFDLIQELEKNAVKLCKIICKITHS